MSDPLRERLRDPRPNERAQAATEAAKVGRRDLAAAVALVLTGDPETWPRAEAAAALGRLGDAAQIGPLLQAFEGDPEELVRGQAAVALGRLGGPELLPRFLDGIRRGTPRVRKSCAGAVGHLLSRHPEILAAFLEQALDSRKTRAGALEALGKYGGEPALRMILGRFAGKSRPGDAELVAADAIRERVPVAAGMWIELLLDRSRHVLWRRLAARGLWHRDPNETPGLADAVLAAAADPAADLREDLHPSAAELFPAASAESRRRLVDALAALRTPDARVLLANLAAEHAQLPEGAAAGRALAGDGDVDSAIEDTLLGEPTSWAARALEVVRSGDVWLSIRMLQIPHLAAAGLSRIRKLRDPDTTPALLQLLEDVDTRASDIARHIW